MVGAGCGEVRADSLPPSAVPGRQRKMNGENPFRGRILFNKTRVIRVVLPCQVGEGQRGSPERTAGGTLAAGPV